MSEPAAATTPPDPLRERVIAAIRTVYDPEIPVNIYDLGLVYDVAIDEARQVHVQMTLTSPFCPVAGSLPEEVREAVADVEDVASASVELVWEPPWTPERMRPEHRIMLGL